MLSESQIQRLILSDSNYMTIWNRQTIRIKHWVSGFPGLGGREIDYKGAQEKF